MIKDFFKDPWTYIGSAATTLMLAMQWLVENLNPILAFLAGIGGVVVVFLGAREKYEKCRLVKKEHKLLDLEIEREAAEIEAWKRNH